jgi:hypothetical protein
MAGDEPDAKKPKSIPDPSSLTSKQYLDQLVVPHLLPALNAVSTNRPSDPIQYLAEYLLKNRGTEEPKPAETPAEQKD